MSKSSNWIIPFFFADLEYIKEPVQRRNILQRKICLNLKTIFEIRMSKIFLIIGTLLMTINGAFAQNSSPHPNTEALEKCVIVVKIYDQYHDFLGWGSGVILDSRGTCISCYHVLENAYYVKVQTQNGDEFEMDKIIAENSTCDLIKFSIKNPNNILFYAVKVSKLKPRKGDDVWAMGTPDDIRNINQITHGGITNIFNENNITILQTDAKIAHGSSGGGLFNASGELIGITGGKFRGEDATLAGRNIAIGVNAFKNMSVVNKERLKISPTPQTYEPPIKMPYVPSLPPEPKEKQVEVPKIERPVTKYGRVSFYTDWSQPIQISIDGSNDANIGTTRSYFKDGAPACGQQGTVTFTLITGFYNYKAKGYKNTFTGAQREYTWNGSVNVSENDCSLVNLRFHSTTQHNFSLIRPVKYVSKFSPYLLIPGYTDYKLSSKRTGRIKLISFIATCAISIGSKFYSDAEYDKYLHNDFPASGTTHYDRANLTNKIYLTSGAVAGGLLLSDLFEVCAKINKIHKKIK